MARESWYLDQPREPGWYAKLNGRQRVQYKRWLLYYRQRRLRRLLDHPMPDDYGQRQL